MARQLATGRETLAGLPDQLELPTDRPRPAVPSYRGAIVPLSLPAELHAACWRWPREGASLFMVLQAALPALLHAARRRQRHRRRHAVAGRTDARSTT